jgi:hypothetical protein
MQSNKLRQLRLVSAFDRRDAVGFLPSFAHVHPVLTGTLTDHTVSQLLVLDWQQQVDARFRIGSRSKRASAIMHSLI